MYDSKPPSTSKVTQHHENWEVDVAAASRNYPASHNSTGKIATRCSWRTAGVARIGGTGFHARPGMLHQTNIQLQTTTALSVQTGLFPATIGCTFLAQAAGRKSPQFLGRPDANRSRISP